jgi:hypothetical protein
MAACMKRTVPHSKVDEKRMEETNIGNQDSVLFIGQIAPAEYRGTLGMLS